MAHLVAGGFLANVADTRAPWSFDIWNDGERYLVWVAEEWP